MTVYAITDTKKGRTGIASTYLQTTQLGLWVGTFLKSKDFLKTMQNNDNLVAPPGE